MSLPTAQEQPTMSVQQAADALGISRSHAYEMVAQGRLPVLRFGRRVVVLTSQLRPLLGLNEPE